MAKKSANNREKTKTVPKKTLEKLISKGKQRGFLTYDEINKALPDDDHDIIKRKYQQAVNR